jgi:hypothetical protein
MIVCDMLKIKRFSGYYTFFVRAKEKGERNKFVLTSCYCYLPVIPEAMLEIPPRMNIIASMMGIMYSPTAWYPMMIIANIRINIPSIVCTIEKRIRHLCPAI